MRALLILYISTFTAGTSSTDLGSIRELYVKASTDEEVHSKLVSTLEPVEQGSPILFGYKAAAHMMSAQYTYNPYSKYRYFKEGRSMIESVIRSHPNDVELRYLRLSIQLNLPEMLNYSENINEDKNFLLQEFKSLSDPSLKNRIRELLIHFELCKASELQ